MQKNRMYKYLAWLLMCAFVCSSVFVTTGNAEAATAGRKKVKSVTVRVDGKKAAKKTVTLRKGEKTTLKVSISPRTAKKRVTYISSKKSVAAVSKKGKVTAKKAGTAKIKIEVSGKGYKKTTWVKIRVVNTTSDTSNTNTPVPTAPTPDILASTTPMPHTPAPAIPVPDTSAPDTRTPAPDTRTPDTPAPATPMPGSPAPNTATPDVKPPVDANGKSLVVYFSRTGTTKSVAEEIQSLTGSDLVELKTVVPYPSSYNDCLAQSQEERANHARPELSTTISNMSEYDTVYVGASDIIRTS